MGKLIKLSKYTDQTQLYRIMLSMIRDELSEMEDSLMTCAINMATSREWYEWSERKCEGACFEFDSEMLSHCNDVNVQALLQLKAKVNLTSTRLNNDTVFTRRN